LVAIDGDVATGVANLLARQLDLVLDRMAARIGLSATGRFYRALLQLADSDGLIQPAPVIAALALSVHTTRETASRALASVVRRGIVERQAEGLHIVSRRMLEELIV
jgi:CRP-like cAMP-binding protein